MYNNCKERESARVKKLTPSLWSFINSKENQSRFLNDSYKNCKAFTLYAECSQIRPRLWCNYYYRTKGVFFCKDPNLEIQQFVEEACLNHDGKLVARARKKIQKKFFPKNPDRIPVVRVMSNSVPTLRRGQDSSITLEKFEIIEDYLPNKPK